MIRKKTICGKEVLVYSIGQACARLKRHPCTIRRLERDGFIPAPWTRLENGYRVYTLHELNILEHIFKKYTLQRGVMFDAAAKGDLHNLFNKLHAAYNTNSNLATFPPEALNDAIRAAT